LLLNPWRSLSVGSGLMRSGASGLPFLIVWGLIMFIKSRVNL
jgi:hypothetical protein